MTQSLTRTANQAFGPVGNGVLPGSEETRKAMKVGLDPFLPPDLINICQGYASETHETSFGQKVWALHDRIQDIREENLEKIHRVAGRIGMAILELVATPLINARESERNFWRNQPAF